MLHAEPFCLACGAGNIPNVTKYLAEKGNPNVSWLGGASPLHVAMGAVKASVEVAKLLIQAGANLNARDNVAHSNHETSMLICFFSGRVHTTAQS